jgi:hypothetical protein
MTNTLKSLCGALTLGALLVAAPGCGDDSGTSTDMAVAKDMAAGGGDMAKRTCAMIISCVNMCSGAGLAACVTACATSGTATGMTKFNALQACAQPACYVATDAGAPPCADPTAAGCQSCVTSKCGTQVSDCLAN